MDAKRCPTCGEKNNPQLTRCWQCKSDLNQPTDPQKIAEFRRTKYDKWARILIYILSIEQFWLGLRRILGATAYFFNLNNVQALAKNHAQALHDQQLALSLTLEGVFLIASSVGFAMFKKWGYWCMCFAVGVVFVVVAKSFVNYAVAGSDFHGKLLHHFLRSYLPLVPILIYAKHLYFRRQDK